MHNAPPPPPVWRGKEQRGRKRGVLDVCISPRRHDRFGVVGNSQAGRGDHVEVVGAVADGERVCGGKVQRRRFAAQRLEFRRAPEDGFAHRAGQRRAIVEQSIGAIGVKTGGLRDALGEEAEPARNQHATRAVSGHGPHQALRAWIEPHAFVKRALQSVDSQALEFADTFAQRRLELDLAAHGALGDCGDFGLHAGEVGELVETFDIDDGGIHVRHQKPLAPTFHRHKRPIHREGRNRRRRLLAQLRVKLGINPLRALPAGEYVRRRQLARQRDAPKHHQRFAISGLVVGGGDEDEGVLAHGCCV